jgi:hypothetical protein
MPSRPITTGEESSPYRAAEDPEDSEDAGVSDDAEVAEESSTIEGVGSSEPDDTTGAARTNPVTAVLRAMPMARRPCRRGERRDEARPRVTAPTLRVNGGGPHGDDARKNLTGSRSRSVTEPGPTVSDS